MSQQETDQKERENPSFFKSPLKYAMSKFNYLFTLRQRIMMDSYKRAAEYNEEQRKLKK